MELTRDQNGECRITRAEMEGQAVPGHMATCSTYLLKPHLSLTRGLLFGSRDCATINCSYQTGGGEKFIENITLVFRLLITLCHLKYGEEPGEELGEGSEEDPGDNKANVKIDGVSMSSIIEVCVY